MPFTGEILKYESLSIAGMEKNTGKTECLNYILGRIDHVMGKTVVTSAGVDGESRDILFDTSKPEIYLKPGTYFATGERFYRRREICSEIYDIDESTTPAGRVVLAKAITGGKIILAGFSDTVTLRIWKERIKKEFDIEHFIIDGALSRLSPASPEVCDAMILTTGASLSSNINTLVRKTMHTVNLINLPVTLKKIFLTTIPPKGTYIIKRGKFQEIGGSNSFNIDEEGRRSIKENENIYFSGVLSDKIINLFKGDYNVSGKTLIVKDFTKIFITPENYEWFTGRGGKIEVLKSARLLAICINPWSPTGYHLDSDKICDIFREKTGMPVYDIIKLKNEAQVIS